MTEMKFTPEYEAARDAFLNGPAKDFMKAVLALPKEVHASDQVHLATLAFVAKPHPHRPGWG